MIRVAGRLGWIALGLFALGLSACSTTRSVPVSDRTTGTQASTVKPAVARPRTPQVIPSTTGRYTVQRGDTLYAIAFANSLDYRDVARWNRIESADRIFVGQDLRLTPPQDAVEIQPLDDDPKPNARPLAETVLLTAPQAVLLPYSDANWAQASSVAATAATNPTATMSIRIIKPGLFSTVQDLGRPNFLDLAVPLSGVMDQASAKFANLLVGNAADAALIEIVDGNFQFSTQADVVIALVSGNSSLEVDHKTAPTNRPLFLPKGLPR